MFSTRPGFKIIARLPVPAIDLRMIEGGTKLVVFTKRGAFWIREGKKPRRIAA